MCPLARPTHRVRVGGAGRDLQQLPMNVTSYIQQLARDYKRRYDLDGNIGALYSK